MEFLTANMEGLPSEVNLFDQQLIQSAITADYVRDLNPIATLQAGAPIEFQYHGGDTLYVDPNDTKIEVKCKITKADGSAVGASDVGPVNNVLHSLFSTVDMELCGKAVTEPNQLYPYRAYLENLLTYGQDVLSTRHYMEGWEKDLAGKMDVTTAGGDNTGLKNRTTRFTARKSVTLIGRLHLDMFHQDKLIPPKCDIKIRLIPSANSFVLKSVAPTNNAVQEQYKMAITSARLFLRTKELNTSLALAHEAMLLKKNYRYERKLTTMKTHHIPAGTSSMLIDNLYLGELPERIVVGLIRDDAINGHYNLNPFNFEHYDLNYIVVKVNGEQVPRVPLTPDFENGDYTMGYCRMLEGLGNDQGQHMIDMKPDEWAKGYTVYVFKLAPGPLGGVRPLTRTGSARMELKFAKATPRNISAVILAEQPGVVEIDKYRNVIVS